MAERSARTIAQDNANRLKAQADKRKRRLMAGATEARRDRMQAGKDITVEAVQPSAAVTAAFYAKLDALIDEMNRSINWWVKAQYRANEDRITLDEAPARPLSRTIQDLGKRWQNRFDEFAEKAGPRFAKASQEHADRAFRAHLKKIGFTVEFKLTPEIRDIVQATIAENVSLIHSIASEYLADVEQLVMRSVANGRDLGYLTKELEARYQITRRRAATIARQQNEAATAVVNRARQIEIGAETAIWKHSAASARHPRKSHLEADGKTYKISEGMFLDGEWLMPGQAINCRCYSRTIISGLNR